LPFQELTEEDKEGEGEEASPEKKKSGSRWRSSSSKSGADGADADDVVSEMLMRVESKDLMEKWMYAIDAAWVTETGETALVRAVHSGDEAMTRKMLKAGADPMQRFPSMLDGAHESRIDKMVLCPPLHIAVMEGKVECAKLLIQEGASAGNERWYHLALVQFSPIHPPCPCFSVRVLSPALSPALSLPHARSLSLSLSLSRRCVGRGLHDCPHVRCRGE
jgi:hypothetical protein